MKYTLSLAAFLIAVPTSTGFAQSKSPDADPTTPRVVVTNTIPPTQTVKQPVPAEKEYATPLPTPAPSQKLPATSPSAAESQASNLNYKGLSFSEIKAKIAEAKRYMVTRPLTIASVEPVILTSLIRVAYYDNNEKKIDSFVLTKDQFLARDLSTMVTSDGGKQVITRTIRGNGVNTPVTVTDTNGRPHLPLMVQYPRETRGVMTEMAYYVSTHPGIVTPEVVNAGRFYVSNTIDVARTKLRSKGYVTAPKIADIAEQLSTLEHVDHLRFRTEYHPNIYNDIFTLYALNEGQTYRYSVSSAGAGGMVQMIPSTYRMIRSRFPNAALMPDFVEGMRDHVNAAQAMLLYIQLTWDDLAKSPTIQNALATGIATEEQLMAAGYNSNPAKLPRYISRGGENWTNLIPRETQIYLQIWDSMDRHVKIKPRKF